MSKPLYISKERLEEMKAKLERMKSVDRPEIAQKISDARDFGDLKENAEYHAAKEKMQFLELKIIDLEEKVRRARIVDPKKVSTDKVYLYTSVSLKDLKRNQTVQYSLVSQEESDFKQLKISVDSPVGKALLGKAIGDIVEIKVPAGILKFEVLEIKALAS